MCNYLGLLQGYKAYVSKRYSICWDTKPFFTELLLQDYERCCTRVWTLPCETLSLTVQNFEHFSARLWTLPHVTLNIIVQDFERYRARLWTLPCKTWDIAVQDFVRCSARLSELLQELLQSSGIGAASRNLSELPALLLWSIGSRIPWWAFLI